MNRSASFLAGLLSLAPALALAAGEHEHHHPPAKAAPAAAQKPWGKAAAATAAQRTIEIVMTDSMRFTPARIEVRQGEIVRLVVRNDGKLLHELVLGTQKEFAEHAAAMARQAQMAHDEAGMTHVPPGAAGEIVWNFNRPGEFDFACLVAGHQEAGMTGKIRVTPAGR